ncbi:MAG: rod shape-determining protein MreC [Candidatus Moranbacteria bacterium]|nr:rod shape-determining protein MreC [Candidatus Moranbacteria bacterium]
MKQLTSKITKTLIILIVGFFLVFLNPKGLFDPLRDFFIRIATPFERASYNVGKSFRGTIDFLGSISDLRKENEDLLRENNELSSQVAELSSEKNENKMLREQMDLVPKEDFDLVSSFVSAQDPQRLDSWVLIDKGSSDGISEGMPVIVSNGILVGRISEVYSSNAKVELLSSPTSSINGVDAATNSRGIVRGEYGLGLVLGMVPQSDTISQGDDVVTSGLGSDTPKGLLIGKIKEVRMSQDRLFQEAIVAPRVKYSKLDLVFVIKNKR